MTDWMVEQMWESEGYTFKGEFEENDMSDFSNKKKERCPVCGIWFLAEEGKDCSCWQCSICGEWFSDFDCLGNKEKSLCLTCEDERYQAEGPTEEDGPWAEGWDKRCGRGIS